MMSIGSDGRRLLWAVLLIAAALRIAACLFWSENLSGDPDAYRLLAGQLLEGNGYAASDGTPTAFRPPLYPLLLTGVLWAGSIGIATLHVGLGVGTVALTAALGRRLGLGRASLLAALVVAIDPLLLRYTPRVMTEVLCTFLAVLLLWTASKGRRSFGLGIVFGLAVLSRPTFWVFGVFVAIVWIGQRLMAICRRRERQAGDRSGWLVALGVLLVVAPWTLRNAVVLGRPILTTTHGGYTLLLANNPVFWREVVLGPADAWDGASLDAWQRSLEAELVERGIESESARDSWMQDRAVEHIRNHPDHFLRSVLYRMQRFWGLTPVGPEAASVAPVVRWYVGGFYLLAFVLALLGTARLAIAALRQARTARTLPEQGSTTDPPGQTTAAWAPALLLIAAFAAVHTVYWTDTRMRAPLTPAIALLCVEVRGARRGSG